MDHVSRPKVATRVFFIRPCGRSDLYVLDLYWTTCHVLALTRVIHWFVHMSNFYLTTWHVLVLPRAQQSLHDKNNSRSTLLHKMIIYIIIEPEWNNNSLGQQQTTDRVHISSIHTSSPHQTSKQTTHMLTASRRLRVTSAEEHEMLMELIVLLLLLFLELLKLCFSLFGLPLQLIN